MKKYFTFTAEELEAALRDFPNEIKQQMLINFYWETVDSALELADFLSTNKIGGRKISSSPGNFHCEVYLSPIKKELLLFV